MNPFIPLPTTIRSEIGQSAATHRVPRVDDPPTTAQVLTIALLVKVKQERRTGRTAAVPAVPAAQGLDPRWTVDNPKRALQANTFSHASISSQHGDDLLTLSNIIGEQRRNGIQPVLPMHVNALVTEIEALLVPQVPLARGMSLEMADASANPCLPSACMGKIVYPPAPSCKLAC